MDVPALRASLPVFAEVGCYLEEPDLVRTRWVPISLSAYSSLALKWHMPVKQQCICTAACKRIRRSSHP